MADEVIGRADYELRARLDDITGVSAGSHTYKLSFAVNGGSTFIVRSFTNNPVVMEVWSAP